MNMNRSVKHLSFIPAGKAPVSRQDLTVPREVCASWRSLMEAMEGVTGVSIRLSTREGMEDVAGPSGGAEEEAAIMGFPVLWPNGNVLGILKTSFPGICADAHGKNQIKTMAEALKKTMEADLELLYSNDVLKKANEELRGAFLNKHNLNIIPVICSYCRRIKDREESWNGIEHYFHSNFKINFSHGICPDCGDELMKKI